MNISLVQIILFNGRLKENFIVLFEFKSLRNIRDLVGVHSLRDEQLPPGI